MKKWDGLAPSGLARLILASICLGLIGFSGLKVDRAAAATVTDSVWPASPKSQSLPLPKANPKRRPRQIASPTTSKSASPRSLFAAPPPLPKANPLRSMRPTGTEALHHNNRLVAPLKPRQHSTIGTDRVKALAPLLHYQLSSSDIALLKKSVEHVMKDRLPEATSSRRRIKDRTARKLALWYALRKAKKHPEPLQIEQFRKHNGDWPSRSILRRNVERILLKTGADNATIRQLYGKKTPSTGIGKFLLARTHADNGHSDKAMKLIRQVWHRYAISKKIEGQILQQFGDKLTRADHMRRADHFLYKDRRRQIDIVRRVAKLLDKATRDKVHLRMEVVKRRSKAADKQFAKLGSGALKDTGLLFSRIQLLRRLKKYEQSWALLHKAPQDKASLVEPGEWWIERRVQVRIALRQNKPRQAYKIVSRYGPLSGKHLIEAEFLSGWIALTRLKNPTLAEKHFLTMGKAVKQRRHIAKAEYWLGRAKQAQGDSIGAITHFTSGAHYYRSYYGQLALQQIDDAGHIRHKAPSQPDNADLKRFTGRDAVRALIISHKAGLNGITPLFFNHLAWRLRSPGEMSLLAELASQIHSKRGSVITGKVGVYRGFNLDRYAYPINAMPHYKRLTAKVDDAFVLALTRQESEFNAKARSHAGARGMMQIMPGTGRMIARQHGVRYNRKRLGSDPSYNVMLGVAHLHDLIKKYNGSFILTLVAYNAGPGRVRDWIKDLGDPRDPRVDAIDWVESIPFSETRRYVQRIMSSAQIFRQRLNNGKGGIRLTQDLNRGLPGEQRKAELDQLIEAATANR